MIRLTDEEIGRVIRYQEQPFPVARMVSKAQLKKVEELHRAIIETDDSVAAKLRKVQEFWQALLDEVND